MAGKGGNGGNGRGARREENRDYTSILKSALMVPVSSDEHLYGKSKVTIVGCGQVGSTVAFTLLVKNLCSDICLYDVKKAKLEAEYLDLAHASVFCKPKICSTTDMEQTAGSKVIVVTAGARQQVEETRPQLLEKNTQIFKELIPPLLQHSPDCVFVIVTNPVDVMTHVAWRLSGLPSNRVIGTGTLLDSMRLRCRIGQVLGVHPHSVHAFVCGEHGDTQFPVWSGVHVNGVRLRNLDNCVGLREDQWGQMQQFVSESAAMIIAGKGYTSWGIATCTTAICRAILFNTKEIMPVSTLVKGCRHGDNKTVYISVPCVLADCGVHSIMKQQLTDLERMQLAQSADSLRSMQNTSDTFLGIAVSP